ncbi:MAG: hypothetical protein ACREJ4_12450 [Candidatus Methylomirabilaceae bacterium]
MTFKHKLSARLALMRDPHLFMAHALSTGAPFLAAILPLLPVKLDPDHLLYSACVALFVKLCQVAFRIWRAASRDVLWVGRGNLRGGRHKDVGRHTRRISDRHPCWEFFLLGPWVLRIAFLQVPKIA